MAFRRVHAVWLHTAVNREGAGVLVPLEAETELRLADALVRLFCPEGPYDITLGNRILAPALISAGLPERG